MTQFKKIAAGAVAAAALGSALFGVGAGDSPHSDFDVEPERLPLIARTPGAVTYLLDTNVVSALRRASIPVVPSRKAAPRTGWRGTGTCLCRLSRRCTPKVDLR